MNFNNIINTSYRWIAVCFLSAVFIIAFCYAFLVGFYAISTSWSAPLTLSPTQDRVLSFQPQVATLEANLNKQKIEKVTADQMIKTLIEQIAQAEELRDRLNTAILSEADQLKTTSASLDRALAAKRNDIYQTNKALTEGRQLMKQIDDELAAKLITSDQAAQRRVSLQGAMNAATDARMAALKTEYESLQLKQGSETLKGGSSSIAGIASVKQSIELQMNISQWKIQLQTATSNSVALEKSITDLERVLNVAKDSPYYRALREEVYVMFVPYDNLKHAKIGDDVYDCALQVIFCRDVGEIVKVFDAEEMARHPLFKTDLKGKLVEVKFSNKKAARSDVLFIGGRPLLI